MPKYRLGVILILSIGGFYFLATHQALRDALGDMATSIIKPIAVPLVGLIMEPSFVYLTALMLFLAGVTVCVIYWLRVVRPEIYRFRVLQAAVTQLISPNERRAQQRFEAMGQLGDLLRKQGMFLSAWALFQNSYLNSKRISNQPFAYFAIEDPTVGAVEQRGFMHAVAGYFISIGLILTFVGLVVALYLAAKGFRSGSIEQARGAILNLLNASAFKFITSVAALSCSLFISIFHRFCLSVLRNERLRTIAMIEAYISAWRDIDANVPDTASFEDRRDIPEAGALADAITRLNVEISRLSNLLSKDSPA